MTPEAMAAMTLADLEVVAERFKLAVDTIQGAQALLGGAPLPATPRTPMPATNVRWTPAEEAERAKLRRANLPDAMRAAEEGEA